MRRIHKRYDLSSTLRWRVCFCCVLESFHSSPCYVDSSSVGCQCLRCPKSCEKDPVRVLEKNLHQTNASSSACDNAYEIFDREKLLSSQIFCGHHLVYLYPMPSDSYKVLIQWGLHATNSREAIIWECEILLLYVKMGKSLGDLLGDIKVSPRPLP